MHRTTHEGGLARDNNTLRSFVVTRSFFLGSQKYGAYWTGDNFSIFSELQGSIWEIISAGLSGMGFGGADIPGYSGVPSQTLYIAMYQLGVFFPFFRAHCEFHFTMREPWLQDLLVQHVIRESVFLRYSLIHYIYTTFAQFSDLGVPLMRPMWLEYPDDSSMNTVLS